MLNRRSFLATSSLAMLAVGCRGVSVPVVGKPKKVPFKFGMAGFTFYRCDLLTTLTYMKKLDVHYLCIKDFHLPFKSTNAEIKAFHQKCADFGVTGYGVGPIYMTNDDDVKRAFEYAARVGVKTLVCVPSEIQDRVRVASRKRCETVSKLCAEYDMRAAIHNHGPDIPKCYPTGDLAYDMVKDLDKRIGLCLDIGHNFRAGLDPAASIHKLADRLYDMHIKNVKFDPKRNIAVPMPDGDMNMVQVVKALCEVGYTGCCSLEYESFPSSKSKEGVKFEEIAKSVGYFKGLIKAAEV